MESLQNLRVINARPVLDLETAIEHWLAAREKFRIEPSDENQNEYNATYFGLGAAFCERYSEATNTPEAFQWYQRGLIAPCGRS